ncbi:MAG: glycosyltransferase [Verrucomicrobia bacterium]|nr:glycosyltransferase [Verrucomicrobiota bacterium]
MSSRPSLELSVVIPVYNEPENIRLAVQALSRHIPVPHEIIVVYDFDADTTVPVLQALAGEYPQLRMAKNTISRGPSGALRTGFHLAQAPLILVTMADLCDDVSQIPHMLQLAKGGVDLVIPSRYCDGGEQQLKESLKVWAPRTAGWMIKNIAGLPTHDPTNSFKLYSAALLRSIRLTSTISFSVTLEIVAKAHCLGYRIVEVPTVWRDRQHGKTNFKLFRSLAAYFPWFVVALLRGRFIRLPSRWLHSWFGAPPQSPDLHP